MHGGGDRSQGRDRGLAPCSPRLEASAQLTRWGPGAREVEEDRSLLRSADPGRPLLVGPAPLGSFVPGPTGAGSGR